MISEQIDLIREIDARKALERLTLADFIGAVVARTDSRDDGIGLFGGLRGFPNRTHYGVWRCWRERLHL